ncbi:G patch domain-containing protein 1 [Mactra antiquata]
MDSNSDDDDTFVSIGTPLEVPDEDEPIKKPVKLEDIQVKDDKGRTRFHGAFTGGFSAGYFNSVGSKEGWAPSTFTSSRKEKYKDQFQQKPEDFMDEEDMTEHGIAPRKFVTGGKFSSEERKKRQLADAERATADNVLPGASALLDIIVPERLTIGVKLLRKMGWKEGQGIGPRLSKKQKTKSLQKVYGCFPPPEDDDLDLDNIVSDVTFAPQDSSSVTMTTKDNTHGLGYRGLDPSKALYSGHVNLFEPPRVTKSGSRRGIRGQGFGVGALEEEDDDIYSVDNMSNYDMTMSYEDDDKFGWTGPSGKKASMTPVSYVGKMLDGFTLSSKKLVQDKDFPPPKLPRDYRPVHKFHRATSPSVLSMQSDAGVDYRSLFKKPDEDRHTGHKTSDNSTTKKSVYTDASSRSLALEEKPFVGSVFDLISKEGKDKMDQVKQGTSQVDNTSSSTVNQSTEESQSPDQTKQGSGPLFQGGFGFKPFQRDPAKQERYERYLDLVKSGHKDPFSVLVTVNQTEWEIEKEKEEFTRAAKLYRPLSGMMAARFTRAGHDDQGNSNTAQDTIKVDITDEQKAADMKMYGKLTHQVTDWYPDNTVCKRFNVPNPYPGSTLTGTANVKREKYSVFNFLNFANPTSSEPYHSTESRGDHSKMSDQLSGNKNTDTTSTEKTSVESTADKVLNMSKSTKSIFSHLVDSQEKGQGSKSVSFSIKPTKSKEPKEFKSIFSHLEKSENTVKAAEEKSESMEVSETNDDKNDTSKMEPSEDTDSKKTEETGMDLFRAIFKNSDSEDESSSSEEESREDDAVMETTKDRSASTVPETKKDNSLVDKDEGNPSSLLDRNQGSLDNSKTIVPASMQQQNDLNRLPGNDENIETLQSRLSPTVDDDNDDDDDSYGPALPPSLSTNNDNGSASSRLSTNNDIIDLTQSTSYKHKHRGKHKSKKDKKEKSKKSKHKKKHKSKDKKKRKHVRQDSDSDTSDKDSDDDNDDDNNHDVDFEILSKLKSIKSSQRKKMMDYG